MRREMSGLVLTRGGEYSLPTIEGLSRLNRIVQIVIVHDMGPGSMQLPSFQDNTRTYMDIAVVKRDFTTFPEQRNAGIDRARGKWVLSLDDDERPSDELVVELNKRALDEATLVYAIPRTEILCGKVLTRAQLHGCKTHPRLFHALLRYASTPTTHEEFEDYCYENMGNLEGHILHEPRVKLKELISKNYAYGVQGAESGRTAPGWLHTALTLPNEVLRKGCIRDGVPGVAVALANTAYKLGLRNGTSA